MSLAIEKERLENEISAVKQQAASTKENWKDAVQRRFYAQFIETLEDGFKEYMKAFESLESSFNKAEEHIRELL